MTSHRHARSVGLLLTLLPVLPSAAVAEERSRIEVQVLVRSVDGEPAPAVVYACSLDPEARQLPEVTEETCRHAGAGPGGTATLTLEEGIPYALTADITGFARTTISPLVFGRTDQAQAVSPVTIVLNPVYWN